MPALVLGALAAGEALGTKAIGVVFVPPLLALAIAGLLIQPGSRRAKWFRVAIVAIVPLATCGYWFLRDAWLTGNPLYPLDVRVMGHTLWAGWYGPDAMRTSPYYLPPGNLGALADIVLALLDPRLAPLWLLAVGGAWAVANPRTRAVRPWIVLFSILAVLNVALYWLVIPYRTQQRFMLHALGLAVVPLAATVNRGRWLRAGAAVLLGLHIVTPQTWPFPAREAAIPWDQSPLIPNAIDSLVVLFPPIEPGYDPGRPAALPFRPLSLGLIVVAMFMIWAWRRVLIRQAGPSSRAWWLLACSAALTFLWLGYEAVGRRALDPMIRFYPPFRDFYAGWRTFDRYCGPRAPAWRMPGPISLIICWAKACATRSAISTLTLIATGCCTTTTARPWVAARAPGRIPGRGGIGSGPTIGPGWRTSMPRGSSSSSSRASTPPRASTTWPTPRAFRSNANGRTLIPSDSHGCMVRTSATRGSGCIG